MYDRSTYTAGCGSDSLVEANGQIARPQSGQIDRLGHRCREHASLSRIAAPQRDADAGRIALGRLDHDVVARARACAEGGENNHLAVEVDRRHRWRRNERTVNAAPVISPPGVVAND